MGKIALNGMEFFAYHGLHQHERQVGNRFAVDLEVVTNFDDTMGDDNIENTVNYEELYQLVKKQMDVPVNLLEYLAEKIALQILTIFTEVQQVNIKVSKFNPPIGGTCREAAVYIEKKRG